MPPADSSRPLGSPSLVAPLALWLILQLLPLLAAAIQLPLSDQFPRPPERLALDEMIVAQIAFSALLFPLLLPNFPSTLIAVAASWPFLQLAGFLAAAPPLHILTGAIFLTLWLLTLGLWRSLLTHRRLLFTGIALFVAWTLGGPLLWYLRGEFVAIDSSIQPWPIDSRLGPIMGGLAAAHGRFPEVAVWLPVTCVGALGGGFSALRWRFFRRRATPPVGESGRP